MVLQKEKHEVSYRYVHDFCDDHRESDGRRWQVPEAAGIDIGWVGVKKDRVMLNFKEKLQVVKTTKGTMQLLFGIGTRSASDGGRTIRANAAPM